MLEMTQEILEEVDPLLDAGDSASAGRLLKVLDATSVRALLFLVLRERGTAVAEAVAATYLSETEERRQYSRSS